MDQTKIVIVEDESIVALDIKKRLQSLGYTVTGRAKSGLDAITKVEETRPNLVLMDIMLPRMNGYEATRAIRATEPVEYRIPIVALTALAMQTDRDRCLETGMDDCLVKPFNREQLYAMVTRWGARREELEPSLP